MAKRKIKVKTDNSSWQSPKKRKKRKPMTEDQRQASAKRLEKARAVRAKKNPNYGQTGVHSSLRELTDDHHVHPDKVKKWIKTQKELASEERRGVREKVKGAISRLASHEGYIRSMNKYLKHGDWIDLFYGEHQENKVKYRCVALGYDKDGNPKRNVDTYYPDIGMIYTQEMINQDLEERKSLDERIRK